MNVVERTATDLLKVLELTGVVIALLAVLGLLLALVRSIVAVALGRSTLVMPFAGGEPASWISDVLSDQLGAIERTCVTKHQTIGAVEGLANPALLDLTPVARVLPEAPLGEHRENYIAAHPIGGESIGAVTLLGVTFSPDFMFAAFYRLRDLAARNTVRGSLYSFDDVSRMSAKFTFKPMRSHAATRSRTTETEWLTVQRAVTTKSDLLGMVDTLAFAALKQRLSFDTGTPSWAAYAAFLDGYLENLKFVQSADISRRDRALKCYLTAIENDSDYHLAHYNAANLLYNKYRETENAKAIGHYRTAAESDDSRLKALSLSGLTMAYAQNIHRYGMGPVPWVDWADLASRQAVNLQPELEETRFARGWALQLGEQIEEAIREYDLVATLEGDSASERQIKSFARNNQAFLLMNRIGNLGAAKKVLEDAQKLYPNKMIYANLGDIARRQGQYDDALAYYAEARALDPLYANALNETGIVYVSKAAKEADQVQRAKLLDEAAKWHERAIGAVPENNTGQLQQMNSVFKHALDAVRGP